jgi:hypothetical protein
MNPECADNTYLDSLSGKVLIKRRAANVKVILISSLTVRASDAVWNTGAPSGNSPPSFAVCVAIAVWRTAVFVLAHPPEAREAATAR